LHPAVQFEGEVQICPHPFHGRTSAAPAEERTEEREARHALNKPLIEAFDALRVEPHRCPNCAPGCDCERGIYSPSAEEPSGGAAAPGLNASDLRRLADEIERDGGTVLTALWAADAVRERAEQIEGRSGGAAALRADVVALVVEQVEALRRGVEIVADEYAPMLAVDMRGALDRIEAAVREGEQR
jgi:hypothetical protein